LYRTLSRSVHGPPPNALFRHRIGTNIPFRASSAGGSLSNTSCERRVRNRLGKVSICAGFGDGRPYRGHLSPNALGLRENAPKTSIVAIRGMIRVGRGPGLEKTMRGPKGSAMWAMRPSYAFGISPSIVTPSLMTADGSLSHETTKSRLHRCFQCRRSDASNLYLLDGLGTTVHKQEMA